MHCCPSSDYKVEGTPSALKLYYSWPSYHRESALERRRSVYERLLPSLIYSKGSVMVCYDRTNDRYCLKFVVLTSYLLFRYQIYKCTYNYVLWWQLYDTTMFLSRAHFQAEKVAGGSLYHCMLSASSLTLEVNEFRCYEAKIEEVKGPAVAGSRIQDTSGFSRQCSATEPRQADNHQPSQSSTFAS